MKPCLLVRDVELDKEQVLWGKRAPGLFDVASRVPPSGSVAWSEDGTILFT